MVYELSNWSNSATAADVSSRILTSRLLNRLAPAFPSRSV